MQGEGCALMQAMQQPPSNHDMETVLSSLYRPPSQYYHTCRRCRSCTAARQWWVVHWNRQTMPRHDNPQSTWHFDSWLSFPFQQALELQYCEAMMGALERAGAPAAAAAFAAAAVQQVIKQTLPMALRPSGLLSFVPPSGLSCQLLLQRLLTRCVTLTTGGRCAVWGFGGGARRCHPPRGPPVGQPVRIRTGGGRV